MLCVGLQSLPGDMVTSQTRQQPLFAAKTALCQLGNMILFVLFSGHNRYVPTSEGLLHV